MSSVTGSEFGAAVAGQLDGDAFGAEEGAQAGYETFGARGGGAVNVDPPGEAVGADQVMRAI